jgi:hypothetical protein
MHVGIRRTDAPGGADQLGALRGWAVDLGDDVVALDQAGTHDTSEAGAYHRVAPTGANAHLLDGVMEVHSRAHA